MNEIKKYESRTGHRFTVYFKESSFPSLRKIITLCDYYRQKQNKTKQGLSYWIALMFDRLADDLLEEIQKKDNVKLEWRDSSLIVIGKKTATDKLIDKAYAKEYRNE